MVFKVLCEGLSPRPPDKHCTEACSNDAHYDNDDHCRHNHPGHLHVFGFRLMAYLRELA